MKNPLLQDFNTLFDSVPFEEIKEEHFLPAMEQAIKEALQEVDQIVKQTEEPSFENTILALEAVGRRAGRIAEVFFNLNSAETNEQIQSIAQELSPKLSAYRNDVMLNQALFERVKKVWDQREQLGLDQESSELLRKSYLGFARNGALLNDKQKEELRALDEKLARLSLSFGENLLAETNAYELYLNQSDLKGLPESLNEQAQEEAKAKGKEDQYLITLHGPSYLGFMTYAEDRALREKLYRAYGAKAFQGNEHDNQKNVLEIAQLRQKRAELLGYGSHADYILEERMAKSPERVNEFLEEIRTVAYPLAKEELAELEKFAQELDGIEHLLPWDLSYYKEKLKQERFAINDELLRPYFSLDRVEAGAFEVAKKLYGISFVERQDIQKYHPEVKTYQVLDQDGSHLALFYADYFPRPGKRSGAWMTSYRSQWFEKGEDQRPHISIVCNFTKPGKDRPSLLTFNEVLTLFHEFGHALHGMLAKGKYASLSGTNVSWDFVELPSQVMENWCFQKEALDLFAEHYQTGEKIPAEYVEKLKASANFMEAYATVRQVSFGQLDMTWHHGAPQGDSVEAIEAAAFEPTRLFEPVDGTIMSCSFGHIFQGGYSAGYYSYKWAEVLDADAFEYFLEEGLFNAEVAQKFRHLLSSGSAIPADELYRQFRGKDPDPKALFRRAGLIPAHHG